MDLPMPSATLTRVQAATGTSEDYDQAAVVGADKWAGSTGAYLTEHTERVPSGNETAVIQTRSLIVDADLNLTFAQGDIVTYIPAGGSVRTSTVRAVAKTKHPGAPGVVRLALEDT